MKAIHAVNFDAGQVGPALVARGIMSRLRAVMQLGKVVRAAGEDDAVVRVLLSQ